MEKRTRSGATIEDRRTEEEKQATEYFVVCTDTALSGWGKALGGKSYFAVPCKTAAEVQIVQRNAEGRSEMQRVRVVIAKGYRPKLREGDHLSIRSPKDCSRWYVAGAF